MIMAVTKPGDHSSQVQKSYKMACQALEMRRVQELRGSESDSRAHFAAQVDCALCLGQLCWGSRLLLVLVPSLITLYLLGVGPRGRSLWYALAFVPRFDEPD